MKRIQRHRRVCPGTATAGMILSILLLASCVEEYWPGFDSKYEELLVVEGLVTDQPGPHYISLSLSTQLEKPEYRPLSGYTVTLFDDQGHVEVLTDMKDGRYRSNLQGEPGRAYRITIVSPAGNSYESDWEKMQEPVGIDTVWAEYEYLEDLDYDHQLEGYRFKVTTENAGRDTTYFLWKLEGTYQYHANHYIRFVFDGEMRPFPWYDSLYMCWRTYDVRDIFTYHTMNLTEPVIKAYPLHYVTTEDKKLSIRYSLYTTQFVITEAAHRYWDNLRTQNSDMGGLYAVLPFQVRGNIRSISDPDEMVLGYFMAAPATTNRIFVNKPLGAKFYYATECNMFEGEISYQLYLMRDRWPVYLAAIHYEGGPPMPALPVKQECVNCTESGGTVIKPDFWISYSSWN